MKTQQTTNFVAFVGFSHSQTKGLIGFRLDSYPHFLLHFGGHTHG